MREFHSDNSAAGSLLISIYIVGMAVGPLFLSPLSELYGRYHILNIANVVFLIASILCAVAVDLPMLIVFRLIMGLACAIPNTVGGGLVADLMPQEERGTALTVWIVGPLLVGLTLPQSTLETNWSLTGTRHWPRSGRVSHAQSWMEMDVLAGSYHGEKRTTPLSINQ